jgi:hypothetical protein
MLWKEREGGMEEGREGCTEAKKDDMGINSL